MPNESQAERAFGFVASQPGGRIENRSEFAALGQFAVFGGNAAGKFDELLSARPLVLDDYNFVVEFDGDLHDVRKHTDECPALLAGGDLPSECLHDLGTVEKAVEVHQHQDSRACGTGESVDRTNRGQRVAPG